jgi:hypothetical protein
MAIRSLKSGTFSRSGMVGNPVIMPNSYESIATITVGSGGVSSIDFTSIPSTYTHLQLRALVRTTSTTDNTGSYLSYNFNNDTTAIYDTHVFKGNGSAVEAAFVGTGQTGGYIERIAGANQTASSFGMIVMDILDYKDTNKYKTVRHLGGFDSNGQGQVGIFSTMWRSASAINRITLYPATNLFAQYTHFALYGVN